MRQAPASRGTVRRGQGHQRRRARVAPNAMHSTGGHLVGFQSLMPDIIRDRLRAES
jgi:hypothetical protein